MIEDIIKSDFSSIFDYSIENIKESQSSDQFPGYTVTLLAQLRESKYTIKLDISNNTLIFPEAIMSNLKSLFGDDKIDLFTYQVENIIAEKFETTLDRGEFNGRIRDLFDVYLLFTVYTELIDYELLKKSILKVSEDRGTLNNLDDYHDLVSELLDSTIFNKNFSTYKDLQYSSYNTTINDVFYVFNKIYEIAIS